MQNDYRLRGYSISNDHAVGIVDVAYDHGSGFYANGSMVAGQRGAGDDLTVVGLIGNVGYARRLNERLTLDTGVVHTSRLAHYSAGTTGRYTEGYVGLNAGNLSARISYSPDYLRDGVKTLYGEVNGGFDLTEKLRLDAHVGYLNCVDYPEPRRCWNRIDYRLGVSRQFERFELHVSVSGAEATSGRKLRAGENPTLVFGASWTF